MARNLGGFGSRGMWRIDRRREGAVGVARAREERGRREADMVGVGGVSSSRKRVWVKITRPVDLDEVLS